METDTNRCPGSCNPLGGNILHKTLLHSNTGRAFRSEGSLEITFCGERNKNKNRQVMHSVWQPSVHFNASKKCFPNYSGFPACWGKQFAWHQQRHENPKLCQKNFINISIRCASSTSQHQRANRQLGTLAFWCQLGHTHHDHASAKRKDKNARQILEWENDHGSQK